MKTLQDNYRLAIARQRLKYWAIWCQDNLTQGLRFPSQNIIGKLISNKGEIIHSTNQTSEIENQEAEEIDKLINMYGEHYPEKVKVLTLHYFHNYNSKKKITLSGLSSSSYFRYLNHAEEWIAQYL